MKVHLQPKLFGISLFFCSLSINRSTFKLPLPQVDPDYWNLQFFMQQIKYIYIFFIMSFFFVHGS